MATRIPFRALLEEDDEVIETYLDIFEQRAKDQRRKG